MRFTTPSPAHLAGAALALLAAGAVLAQDAADHGANEKAGPIPTVQQGLAPAITALVVFGIVFAILATKVWPRISAALEAREAKIRSDIQKAELAERRASQMAEQYERNLAEARAEARKMLDQAMAQQQALSAELRAKADAEVAQLRQRARRDIESAKTDAITEIYDSAGHMAALIAAKILKREITPQDQQRLMEESLRELEGVGRA